MKTQSVRGIFARTSPTYLVFATMLLLAVAIASTYGQDRPAPPGPQTYELRCRGGGLKLNDAASGPGARGRIVTVTVDFIAGTKPSGSQRPTNLNSGECSWVDRGLRKGEPTQIRLQKPGRDYSRMQEILSSSDRYWTFQVYNTNNGYMASTRDMEWDPPSR